jgi:hypothetical protein
MGLGAKIIDALGGSAVTALADFVNDRWPSEIDKAKAVLEAGKLDLEREKERNAQILNVMNISNEAEKEFNERTTALEGTATDVKEVWLVGPLILLFRGMQRPLWGFATMWLDFKTMSGSWDVNLWQTNASGNNFITPEGFILIIINFLVLAFLFGERALVNILPVLNPIIEKIWGTKAETK